MWDRRSKRRAFTMLEIVVAIVLLSVAALGYAVVTASLARAFLLDARRQRAGDIAETQREILLRQGCVNAGSGSATKFGLPVEWSVTAPVLSTRTITIVVTRPSVLSPTRDSLAAVVPCT